MLGGSSLVVTQPPVYELLILYALACNPLSPFHPLALHVPAYFETFSAWEFIHVLIDVTEISVKYPFELDDETTMMVLDDKYA